MEEQYNWPLIFKVALPVSLLVAYIFSTNIPNFWKWISLAFGMFGTGSIIYKLDRKKHNIFTSVALVFLIALVVKFLKDSGFIR